MKLSSENSSYSKFISDLWSAFQHEKEKSSRSRDAGTVTAFVLDDQGVTSGEILYEQYERNPKHVRKHSNFNTAKKKTVRFTPKNPLG